MQTRALHTLLEIETVGSFADAAKKLNMTLSSLSMQMKALETELNIGLFDRNFRPPKLTPLGRAICEKARSVIAAENQLLAVINQGEGLTGNYRIGFVATASVRLLPAFLMNSRKMAPNARFDIETGLSEVLEARVRNGTLDAAVVTASGAADVGLRYRKLRQERLAFVAPRAFQQRSLEHLFTELPFFHFLPNSGIGKVIEKQVRGFEREDQKSVYLDSIEAIMECVNQGIGFTLLPEPDIERSASEQTVLVENNLPDMTRHLVLATGAKGGTGEFDDQLAALFRG